MSEPKLHHFLPQSYLERFADEHRNLYVTDRVKGVVRRQSPEVTGAERDLYAIEDESGRRDRSVETALAELVDGPGQDAMRGIEAGRPLTHDEINKLATFVAALYVQTPAFREQNRRLGEEMHDWLRREGVEPATEPISDSDPYAQQLRAAGGVRTDELLAALNEMRSERRPYQNDFVRLMVGLIPMVADSIFQLDWFIASAPVGKAFITGDAPLIIFPPPNQNPLIGVGLTTPGSQKIIPLTSGCALVMGDQVPRPVVRHITLSRDVVRSINEAVVRRCERFAMGKSRPLIESLLRATGVANTEPQRRSQMVNRAD